MEAPSRQRRRRRPSGSGSFRRARAVVAALALGLAAGAGLVAAEEHVTYQLPPQALIDVVDAPPTPEVEVAPGGDWLLLLERPSFPPLAELAERELRLAGLRISPRLSGPSRTRPWTGVRRLAIADGGERPIEGLPAAPRLERVSFSPDGERFAFTHQTEAGLELWVAELSTGRARRLSDRPLNLAGGLEPRWLADSSSLVAPDDPAGRGPEPEATPLPGGPIVQESPGYAAPARTYQDLLGSPHDEALFEHYLRARLARFHLDGRVEELGEPELLAGFEPSPDGAFLLVEAWHRPFSYQVPAERFPRRIEIWDPDGNLVRRLADLPLAERVPITFDSVPPGPRAVSWRADAPSTLSWVEALDGGDAGVAAAERDALYLLPAPFDGEARRLASLALRCGWVYWGPAAAGQEGAFALVEESWWKTRRTRTWILRPDSATAAPELLFDRSYEDRYGDPGLPLTRPNAWGRQVLATAEDGRKIYLVGEGASPEGDRPFLDLLDLGSRQSRRLFHSEAPFYERPLDVLWARGESLLLRRESVEAPPNYFVASLPRGGLRRLTSFPHPTPQLRGLGKELIRYSREDGVALTATLYTPPGWRPGDGPLPTLLWAYPQEFKTADAAGQVTTSPYRFARVDGSSPLVWLAQGYVVLDDPSMPIVGEGDAEPNDRYVEQLVASARAAVEELVRRGVADRRRIAVGGHSYGAFMTANLLAHSDLFAAGIAQSGAYNRTLTPFGFQQEERSLWQAPEVYVAMSPFVHAHRIAEPILLLHGAADSNSGTYPLQSERLFAAVKGLGGRARLVLLPFEGHGYRSRESVLHALWEKDRWLETYVKNRPAEGATGAVPAGGQR